MRVNRIKIKYENQDRTPVCGICNAKRHFRNDCPKLQDLIARDLDRAKAGTNPGELPTSEIQERIKEQEENTRDNKRTENVS